MDRINQRRGPSGPAGVLLAVMTEATLRARGTNGSLKRVASIVLLAIAGVVPASAADDLKAFPAAEEGMTRHVIRLPKQGDESAFKVELIIGKTVKTDAGNRYFFGGQVEVESIPGWGYERYILRQLGPMAGTLMAVDPGAPLVERFISIGGEARLLRYNSLLPLVVYVPVGVEVRYRVWRAEPTTRPVAHADRMLALIAL